MSVTAPAGFRAAGVTAGLKPSGRPDVALVVNDGPDHHAAAVFTGNRVEAAPVTWSRQVLADGRVDAVVLNSGGANACTGAQGFADTHATAEHVAQALGVSAGDVAVCSTGLIGELLPMDRLTAGVTGAAAALSADGGADAAEAICTTDTVTKQVLVERDGWSVGGMAKGAGMLAPALATMLVVLTTDAVADAASLDAALRSATATTFDRIDSDGCMSTNDTVLLLASGASGVTPEPGRAHRRGHRGVRRPGAAAHRRRRGRRPRHRDRGALAPRRSPTRWRSPAPSPATTCSSAPCSAATPTGAASWPRSAPPRAAFEPAALDVAINGVLVCRAGGVGEDRSLVDLGRREVHVVVDLHAGDETATVWTNDLTHDYVHENSAYST